MKNREIKFRVWNTSVYPDLLESTIVSLDNTNWININKETNGGIDLFTGLYDKNGVEIYEGDIVSIDWEYGEDDNIIWYGGEVKWDNEEAKFYVEDEGWSDEWNGLELEVMGNIYQNPELLTSFKQ